MIKKKTKKEKIAELVAKLAEWDRLAKDNDGNKHNLSTSERQDWIEELIELGHYK